MLHKPSFVEKEEEKGDSEVVCLKQRFNHPSLNLHPVLQCVVPSEFVQHVGGDLERLVVELESSPPHLFLYLFLFKKTKVETRRDSTGLNTGEPKLYWIKEHYCFEH